MLSLIWAQAVPSGLIGRDGGIPWRLPEDLAHFKELTLGHTVVMGRRTWESLPATVRPLPGRRNVVITRQADYHADGADVARSLDEALAGERDVWVMGGGEIYALALPLARRCEVTEVDVDLPVREGDALAPALDGCWTAAAGQWLVGRSGLRYRFVTYARRRVT